jgi:two-component system, NarL family, nitrate/nitrite response regulator NarL
MTYPDQDRRIRLLLLAGPGLFRPALACFLAYHPDFEVIQECADSGEALEVIGRSPVDVVLLDFDMGLKAEEDFIAEARRCGYQGRFLILTGTPDVGRSTLILKLGASGLFLKSETPERLREAIRIVAQGGAWIDGKVLHLIIDQLIEQRPTIDRRLGQRLDSQEQTVLAGIIGGLSNRKIASDNGVSENVIKNIVQRLFRKAGVKSRSQLVRVALSGSAPATDDAHGRLPSSPPPMRLANRLNGPPAGPARSTADTLCRPAARGRLQNARDIRPNRQPRE